MNEDIVTVVNAVGIGVATAFAIEVFVRSKELKKRMDKYSAVNGPVIDGPSPRIGVHRLHIDSYRVTKDYDGKRWLIVDCTTERDSKWVVKSSWSGCAEEFLTAIGIDLKARTRGEDMIWRTKRVPAEIPKTVPASATFAVLKAEDQFSIYGIRTGTSYRWFPDGEVIG